MWVHGCVDSGVVLYYTYSYLLGSMPAGSAGYRTAAAAARTASTPSPVFALHSRYGAAHRCTDFLFRNRLLFCSLRSLLNSSAASSADARVTSSLAGVVLRRSARKPTSTKSQEQWLRTSCTNWSRSVTHPLHKIAARQQTDGGAAAQVELHVCARAALLITCTGTLPGAQYCTKCARAYSSFVSRLLAVRGEVRPESGAVGW